MKKALIVIAALILFPVIAAAVFLMTFDADRYRPLIVQKIQEATGLPADIGRLSLGWRNGLSLEIGGLVLYSDAARRLPPGLKLESAGVVIRLLPLLKRDVEVGSITVVHPQVMLEKNADGSLWMGGLNLSQGRPASKSDKAAAGVVALSIDSISIVNAEVDYRGSGSVDSTKIQVKDLDLRVSHFSLFKPFSFDLRAAIFSPKQNLKVNGKILLPQPSQPGSADDLTLTTDLGEIDLRKLAESVPQAASAGIASLAGRLTVSVDHADLSPDVAKAVARVVLEKGRVAMQGLKSPVEDIQATASLKDEDIKLDNLTASMAGGKIGVTGNVRKFLSQPVLDVKAAVRDLDLRQVLENAAPDAPTLNGRLSLDLDGRANGLDWPSISHTLTGQSRLILKDGVLLNYNLLREVMSKLSFIPGVEESIRNNFPQTYQAALAERSTLLKPLNLEASIRNGIFTFTQLTVQTDFLTLYGAGQIGLDRSIRVNSMLDVNAEMSGVLARAVPQTQLLLNPRGELEVPIRVEGMLPQVLVIPDVQYLTSRVVASGAQQVLGSIASGKDPKESLEAALGGFLKQQTAATQ